MIASIHSLPTHIALVAGRCNALGPSQTADSFLLASYLVESVIKSIGIALVHGMRANALDAAYRFGYNLVSADGLGEWESAIREMTSHPMSSFLPIDFRPLVAWVTRKRTTVDDAEFRAGYTAAQEVLERAGSHVEWSQRTASVRDLISTFVQIRNSTKAHGAWGPDFYADINERYLLAINALIHGCPVLTWDWIHISMPSKDFKRGTRLVGPIPAFITDNELENISSGPPGIYFSTAKGLKPYSCSTLFQSDLECRHFYVPNGGRNEKNQAEFIDYSSGEKRHVDVSFFSVPPSPLPPSETEGMEAIDIQSNILGNLPSPPRDYVQRQSLQEQLATRLLDKNHTIITLHGQGGMGKTSLALFALHSIAQMDPSPFEYILWFSARDVDLRVAGPVRVRTAVLNLDTVTRTFGRLFSITATKESFALVLANPMTVRARSILFVFDNFETMTDLVGLHEFLDTHTHLPNKVLITSRERGFKGDFPIEVRGMEWKEAQQMLDYHARQLGISGLVANDTFREVHDATDGHPYVMRVLLGEIAKEQKVVPLRQLIPRRQDIVNSVFERSFERLSTDGRWVFLVVSNWRSVVFEIALVAVLSAREIDVEKGAEECVRLSLILQDFTESGQATYSAPELARTFGRKKLEGDPDRLPLEESISLVQNFGPLASTSVASSQGQDKVIDRFVRWCFAETSKSRAASERLDALLEAIANVVPPVWMEVAKYRIQFLRPRLKIEYSLRRAVEELPTSKEARLQRANYARQVGDDLTQVSSLISAVEVAPDDLRLVTETAHTLIDFINKHKGDIPTARRGLYLASVRSNMERLSPKLDSVGLSRLAWLFLLEGNEAKAHEYASAGHRLNPMEPNCKKIIERLQKGKPRSK